MPLLIRSLFPNIYIGTLDQISGLVQLKHLNLSNCQKLIGMILLFGNNQGAHPLADFQGHWLLWRDSANWNHLIFDSRNLLVSQFPKFVRAQPSRDLIG